LLWSFFGLALLPGTGLVLLEQANLIVERIVASHLQEGAIASLDYARFLVETPLVTLGVGITQTVLPKLSDLSAIGDREKLVESTRRILLACLWALLPLSVWLISFGEDLIRIVYARGAFGESSVATTNAALGGFAIGLWAWFGGTILQRAYYAERRLRILLPLSALGLATFGVLSILWAPHLGVRGVSSAFSTANIVYFAASLVLYGRGLARSVIGVLGYLLLGGALLYILGPGIAPNAAPLIRLLLGATLFVFAWAGWTILHPSVRRLALELLRTVGRAR
jgi:putative peptidoglycan lipid II flippase